MNRKIYYWKLRSVELQLGEKTLIMGILNVTPDSFSDGGNYSDPDRAYARALELEEQGADILDIGGESTRPGSERISAEEEWRRLAPVLKRLRDKLTIPISLDTYKSETAERAFDHGIEIINDPSGLTFDADLAKTVANANAGLILNHMRGTPETWAKLPPLPDMIGSVVRDLEATINRARRAGVERNRIAVDPGLGFGKRREQNTEILAHLRQLATLDCPVLIGPSRKSFLAQSTEPETLYATAAAVTASILNGAHIVRVHDVKEMRAAVQIADDIVRALDAKEAVKVAQEAAERPVPRRTQRDLDERPRSVRPPVAKPAPVVVTSPAPTPVTVSEVVSEPEATATESDVTTEATATTQETPAETPVEKKITEIREVRPAAKPYADRPLRRDFGGGTSRPPSGDRPPVRRDSDSRPPRRDFGGDSRPPSGDSRPPRRDFGGDSRPPRRDFGSDSRPPRRDFGSDSRPPRRDFGGDSRPPRRDFGGDSRPPRRDFGGDSRPPRGDSRPPSGDSRPPRRDFGSDSRPPRRDFGGSRPPSGDSRPPRRDFGGDSRPPRRDFGASRPPSGDSRPPRRDFGGDSRPPSGGDRPQRRDFGPPRGGKPGGGPPRPFRKRP